MRRGLVAVGVIVAGLIGLVLAAALHGTSRAATLGVHPGAPVAPLRQGDTVCQWPIDVAAGADFDAIDMSIGTYGKRGSPLLVGVVDGQGHKLARGRIPGGYPDIARQGVHRVRLDRTVSAPRIGVCVRNLGTRKVALYGDVDLAARTSTAFLNKRPLGFDVALDFERPSRSMASLVPRMLDRASLFRFAGQGPWVYIVLAALLVLVAPWLLVRALAAAGAGGEVTPPGAARTRRRPRA